MSNVEEYTDFIEETKISPRYEWKTQVGIVVKISKQILSYEQAARLLSKYGFSVILQVFDTLPEWAYCEKYLTSLLHKYAKQLSSRQVSKVSTSKDLKVNTAIQNIENTLENLAIQGLIDKEEYKKALEDKTFATNLIKERIQ